MDKFLKTRIEKLLNRVPLSRRDFFKYAGLLGGVSILGRELKGSSPSKAHALDLPRVASVHNPDATNWDYVTGFHWNYINQSVVNDMVARGVMTLTGASTLVDAWKSLIPYTTGEAVAIKVNLNNTRSCPDGDDNDIDAYPETVNAVIDGLISIGVPPEKIWITDPSRYIPARFINKINNPDVWYYTTRASCGGNTYETDYVDADSPDASPTTHPAGDLVRPAQVFVDADHLINIPQLKGHGHGWITLGMKNHYGSIIFKNYPDIDQNYERQRLHEYIKPGSNPDPEKSTLADINNNPHIKDKTRLIIGDGLFGHPVINWQSVAKWEIFNNDDPNILFFGTDPIATDSVMSDYINEEQLRTINRTVIHSSLHHGAAIGLGVHDHWDSFMTKQYSLIDYIQIESDNKRLSIDQAIRDYKNGTISLDDVMTEIEGYMTGI